MGVNEYGGSFDVYGKVDDKPRVSMKITKDDQGIIGSLGKDGKGNAEMGVNEYGGVFNAFGKVDNKSRASMQISEYGYGSIGLWDKDGYRLK